jgi:hypothetical protein
MVLQDPKTGSQYSFELKDRIIRDDDNDGWIEIPVKPSVSEDGQADTEGNEDNGSSSSAKPLPGDHGGIVSYQICSRCQAQLKTNIAVQVLDCISNVYSRKTMSNSGNCASK